MGMTKRPTFKEQLQSTVGLSDFQAREVAACLKDFLRDKLPDFLAAGVTEVAEGNKIDFSEMFKEDARATYYAMSDKKVKPGERTQAEIDRMNAQINDFFNNFHYGTPRRFVNGVDTHITDKSDTDKSDTDKSDTDKSDTDKSDTNKSDT